MIILIFLLIIYLVYNNQNHNLDCNVQTSCSNPSSNTQCKTTTSVVLKKACGNDSSLIGLQPGGSNQVLVTNDAGGIEWENQCSFNGVDNQVTSIKGGGFVINTFSGTDCFRTLVPTASNQIPIIDASGNVTWINVDDLLALISFAITTLDGLAANGVPGGVLNNSGTLGLDSWEISSIGKVLRPKTSLVGSLGDSSHILSSTHAVNMNLYNGINAHTIQSGAVSSYTWRTPTSNPPVTSLIQADSFGNLSYLSGGSSGQVLVTGPGNVPIWIDQCTFDGTNINQTSVPFNNSGSTISGVLANTANTSTCLRTINPGTTAINSANKVLVTDAGGNMTWVLQTSLLPPLFTGTVTSVGTSDGLTVGGIAGATITATGVLGLDGWEIIDGSKILRPKTGFTGKIGDPTHVVFNSHFNTVLLYSGLNAHSITTAATGSYSWRTPSNNPSVLSLVNCDSSGNLGYFGPANANQVLVSSGWIDQCSFAGLNNIVSITSISPGNFVSAGVIVNQGTSTSCLETVRPGTTGLLSANKMFVTDASGQMTWVPLDGDSGVTSVGTSDGLTVGGIPGATITTTGILGLDGWEIVDGSKVLRPKTAIVGKIGDLTHAVNEIYDNSLKMVAPNSNVVTITPSSTTTTYGITLPTQINPSFNNNSVLSINNTGVSEFSTKLKYDNVTTPYNIIVATPLNSPYNITTLNTVYEFDMSLFVGLSLSVVIPDSTIVNQGFSVAIYKKSSDTIPINITTVSNQTISGLPTISISNQGDTLYLGSMTPIKGWFVIGANVPASINFIVNFSQKIFSATFAPLVSSTIVGSGNKLLQYDTITDNSLAPVVAYNVLNGQFTFTVSGRYTFWALQTIAFNSSGAQGNAHSKIVLIQGIDATGTEILQSPGLFYNNKTEAGRYSPALLSIERSVNIVAGLPYVLVYKISTEDANGIVEFSPSAITPGVGSLNLISGSIEIRRLP